MVEKMADSVSGDPKFEALKFNALRNALYHTARAGFLDRINKLINFAVIFLGTAVVGTAVVGRVAPDHDIIVKLLEISVVVVSTLQLVFDFGSSVRKHEFLQKKYFEILSEIELEEGENYKKWNSKLLAVYGDENVTMRALDAVAYNGACDALYAETWQIRLKLRWFHLLFRNIFAFHNTKFERAEVNPPQPRPSELPRSDSEPSE